MEFVLTLAKSIGVMFLLSGLGMGFVLMILVIWVKKAAKGKAYAFYFEPNRQLTTELISVGVDGNPERFVSKDEGEYLISAENTFWYSWPPGFPDWVKQPVPCVIYRRNCPDPINPISGQASGLVTSQSLKYMQDENMLRSMWRDASESINDTKPLGKNNWLLYIGISSLVAILILGYVNWTTLVALNEIRSGLGI